jgi:hypothetical protein
MRTSNIAAGFRGHVVYSIRLVVSRLTEPVRMEKFDDVSRYALRLTTERSIRQ